MAKDFDPVGRHLVFTAKAMREAFEDMLEAEGATLGTWVVLSTLSRVGCVSQAALASHVHLEGATITHHIDRLELAGLVTRRLDPADRRVRMLELTPAGLELHIKLFAAVVALEQRVMKGISAADRETLRQTLVRLDLNLAAIVDVSSSPLPAA